MGASRRERMKKETTFLDMVSGQLVDMSEEIKDLKDLVSKLLQKQETVHELLPPPAPPPLDKYNRAYLLAFRASNFDTFDANLPKTRDRSTRQSEGEFPAGEKSAQSVLNPEAKEFTPSAAIIDYSSVCFTLKEEDFQHYEGQVGHANVYKGTDLIIAEAQQLARTVRFRQNWAMKRIQAFWRSCNERIKGHLASGKHVAASPSQDGATERQASACGSYSDEDIIDDEKKFAIEPGRPPSAYFLFAMQSNRPSGAKNVAPNEQWADMSQADRRPYECLAQELKQIYEQQMSEWRQTGRFSERALTKELIEERLVDMSHVRQQIAESTPAVDTDSVSLTPSAPQGPSIETLEALVEDSLSIHFKNIQANLHPGCRDMAVQALREGHESVAIESQFAELLYSSVEQAVAFLRGKIEAKWTGCSGLVDIEAAAVRHLKMTIKFMISDAESIVGHNNEASEKYE